MYNSIGVAEKIKNLAKLKKIPIQTLLRETNLGRNTMANFKTSMPKADNLAKIADYLNCSVDYLLGRTDCPDMVVLNDDGVPVIVEAMKSQEKE